MSGYYGSLSGIKEINENKMLKSMASAIKNTINDVVVNGIVTASFKALDRFVGKDWRTTLTKDEIMDIWKKEITKTVSPALQKKVLKRLETKLDVEMK